MNKTKIFIMTFLVAALAVGCTKEKSGRIYIFAENFQSGHNGKVLIDPANVNGNTQWTTTEFIRVNGSDCVICGEGTNRFYVSPGTEYNASEGVTAIYPSSTHNNYDVTLSDDGDSIILNRLSIKFNNVGQHEMAFPMVATGSGSNPDLEFKHITGGLKLTLHNTSTTESKTIYTLKVIAKSNTVADNLAVNGVTAMWAVQGVPSVPSGSVGGSDEDRDVKYISEMLFDMKSGINDGYTFAINDNNDGGLDERTFCVPITISKVNKITVIGYDANGFEVFRKTSSLSSTANIAANMMYTVKTIEF